ncbi:MAG: AAA family ATPase [Anaerolineaceae bacterium]
MTHANPARLILVCGLPGAGKTTLARQLERQLPAIRLCCDEWLSELGWTSSMSRCGTNWRWFFGNTPNAF